MRRFFRTMLIVLAATVVAGQVTVTAQNRRSADRRPRPRPFAQLQAQIDALQAQIDALEVRVDVQTSSLSELSAAVLALEARAGRTEASVAELQLYRLAQDALIEQLTNQWKDAEARLAENAASIQLLLQADQALQALIAAVQLDVDADAGLIAALNAAVAAKQQAIQQSCPVGSSIRQITSTGTVVCEVDDGGGTASLSVMDLSDGFQTAAPGNTASSQVYCPSGFFPTGGGHHKDFQLDVYFSGPSGNGWQVAAANFTPSPRSIRAFVKCARVQ